MTSHHTHWSEVTRKPLKEVAVLRKVMPEVTRSQTCWPWVRWTTPFTDTVCRGLWSGVDTKEISAPSTVSSN